MKVFKSFAPKKIAVWGTISFAVLGILIVGIGSIQAQQGPILSLVGLDSRINALETRVAVLEGTVEPTVIATSVPTMVVPTAVPTVVPTAVPTIVPTATSTPRPTLVSRIEGPSTVTIGDGVTARYRAIINREEYPVARFGGKYICTWKFNIEGMTRPDEFVQLAADPTNQCKDWAFGDEEVEDVIDLKFRMSSPARITVALELVERSASGRGETSYLAKHTRFVGSDDCYSRLHKGARHDILSSDCSFIYDGDLLYVKAYELVMNSSGSVTLTLNSYGRSPASQSSGYCQPGSEPLYLAIYEGTIPLDGIELRAGDVPGIIAAGDIEMKDGECRLHINRNLDEGRYTIEVSNALSAAGVPTLYGLTFR